MHDYVFVDEIVRQCGKVRKLFVCFLASFLDSFELVRVHEFTDASVGEFC